MQTIQIGKCAGINGINHGANWQDIGISVLLMGGDPHVPVDLPQRLPTCTTSRCKFFGDERIVLTVEIEIVKLLFFLIDQNTTTDKDDEDDCW